MKFIKKPIVVDAIQWLGTKISFDQIVDIGMNWDKWRPGEMGSESFTIITLEGDMLVKKGDWVIKGVNGEFYPCKPDIFEKTYERIE